MKEQLRACFHFFTGVKDISCKSLLQSKKEVEIHWSKIGIVQRVAKTVPTDGGLHFHELFMDFRTRRYSNPFTAFNSPHFLFFLFQKSSAFHISHAQTASAPSAVSELYIAKWRMDGSRFKLMSCSPHCFTISRGKKGEENLVFDPLVYRQNN